MAHTNLVISCNLCNLYRDQVINYRINKILKNHTDSSFKTIFLYASLICLWRYTERFEDLCLFII